MTDNLRIWKAVEKTNPAHTKHVNQRGGFTAISASYQILAATEQFGPIGIGWGYTAGDPIICETLVMVPVTLWHGNRENTFGPMIGAEEWRVKDRIDSDAPKKATTDALTKLLSQLGFNADVFQGKFDDSKYVAQMTREFAAKDGAERDAPPADALLTEEQRIWLAGKIEASVCSVQTVCEQFNVSAISELTFGKAQEVVSWLKTQKKAA